MRLLDSLSTINVGITEMPRFVDYDDLWREVDRILGSVALDEDVNSISRQHTVFHLVQLVINTSLSLSGKPRTSEVQANEESDDCVITLLRMAQLEDCWYDEDSRAPSKTTVLNAIEILHRVPGLTALVSTGPTYDGGVILEYQANGWSYAIEVLNSGKVEFYGVEIDGEGEADLLRFNDVSKNLLRHVSMSIR